MKKQILSVTAVLGLVLLAFAAVSSHRIIPSSVLAQSVGPQMTVLLYPSGSDPCSNPSIAKSQKAVNISGAAATNELVAAAAGKTVYACTFQASDVGTSPTIQFDTGTKVSTACDTGDAHLTGVIVVATGTLLTIHANSSFLQSAASGELCLVAGGTTPSIQGFLTYVQT